MLKKVLLIMAQGLVAIIPIMLTVYALYWVVASIELAITPIIPDAYYFPGLGLVACLALLFVAGLMVNAYFIQAFLNWGGSLFEKIPLVKTLYGAIQDAVNLINVGQKQKMQSVVSVEMTEHIHLIGFVTNHDGANSLFEDENKLAVYIPFSYQIGGYTLYIDKEKVSPLDIDVETAMRISLTGGSSNSSKVK
ncbi:DUF502 domain-containing protein [Alteromonadaceae bacterium BrNp21-10]|nr:DUF502 domain-containing protein [Alteromonadaceae bacterium BrNp21-10]